MTDMQPGQLIVPHDDKKPADGADTQSTASQQQPDAAVSPTPVSSAAPTATAPTPAPQSTTPVVAVTPAAAEQTASNQAGSFYKPSQDAGNVQRVADHADEDIMWTAAEFVENHKGTNWYLSLLGVGAVASAIAYFLLKDLFSAIVIALAIIAFAVYASRKPRDQQYHLNTFGVQVGTKVYEFHDFKAFSVMHDEGVISIVLRPLKRFMPSPSLYVIPEVEERVIEVLSMVLPAEQHKPDAIDSLMRKIRF